MITLLLLRLHARLNFVCLSGSTLKETEMKPIKIDTADLDNAEARAAIGRHQHDCGLKALTVNPDSGYWKGKVEERRATLATASAEVAAARAKLGAALDPALEAVNGKATARTIHSYRSIIAVAARAEAQLADAGLPKAFRKGASLHYRPAGPAANAYKYKAQTTRLTIERRGTAWYLTSVERDELYPKQAELFSICIAPDQAETIRKAAIRPFVVTEAA